MSEQKDDLERRIQGDIQQEIILTTTRESRPYSLILFDIDHFKAFNDLYSYPQGDEVLNGIRHILGQMHTQRNFVGVYGNYGGDEFLIALPATSIDEAVSVATKLQETVAKHPFEDISTHTAFHEIVSLSLGISMIDLLKYFGTPDPEGSSRAAFDTLLKQSNIALDYGKVLGGGMVHKFHEFLDREWNRVKEFRKVYFTAPFSPQSIDRLKTLPLSLDLRAHMTEDFSYLQTRLQPQDTRILANFADRAYRKHILTYVGDKDLLISSLQQAVNQ